MKKKLAILLGSALPGLCTAMVINPGGTGQVLLFPYYTVNAHQQTLLTVTNNRDEGKALRVNILEGYNGRDVLSFNLYLGPHDTWTGTLFSLNDANLPGSAGALATDDASCTIPSFTKLSTKLPNGDFYQPFLHYAYTDSNADTGPTDDSRTREGHIEVIEMADITGTALIEISADNLDNPPTCSNVANFSSSDPDFEAPTGGISGTAGIINVPQGTYFATTATAIDGFRKSPFFVPQVSQLPDLRSASASASGAITAYVPVNGSVVTLNYPSTTDNTDQSIDAISSLLLASQIQIDWDISTGLGAHTDWVITFPTKHYYVDSQLYPAASNSNAPFSGVFGQADKGAEFESTGYVAYDRTGTGISYGPVGIDPPPPSVPSPSLGQETQVLTFLPWGITPPSTSTVLGSSLVVGIDATNSIFAGTGRGTAQLDFASPGNAHAMSPSTEGFVLQGLPVIAFEAVNYVNANVTAGVLANYSAAYPSRTNLACPVNHATNQTVCP